MLFSFQSKTFMPLMKITQMMFEKKKKNSSLNESTEIQKKKKSQFEALYGIWKQNKKSFEKPQFLLVQ